MNNLLKWLKKVLWPIFEPILRWGLRLSVITALVWVGFYAEFASSARQVVKDGLTIVFQDLRDLAKSDSRDKKENATSFTALTSEISEKRKKRLKAKFDQCMKEVKSSHTSCMLSSWANTSGVAGNPKARAVCEDKRLQRIDRCEDRYGRL